MISTALRMQHPCWSWREGLLDTPHLSMFRLFVAAEEVPLVSAEITPPAAPSVLDFVSVTPTALYSGKCKSAQPWSDVREVLIRNTKRRLHDDGQVRIGPPIRLVMAEWHSWIEGSITFNAPSPEDRDQQLRFTFSSFRWASVFYPAHLDPQALITWEERILDDPAAVVGYHDWLYEHGWPERAKELEPKVERYLR